MSLAEEAAESLPSNSDQPIDTIASPTRIKTRLATILATHSCVDTYAAFVPALLGILEVRCDLTMQQSATLLGIGSFCSGLSQPLTAWLNDRYDSRTSAAIGLFVGAICISLIGCAGSFVTLLLLYGVGTFAVGIYHPPAAATAGQLSGAHRSFGMSLFFVGGMSGGILGNLLAPRIVALPDGFRWLMLCMIPGMVLAAILHVAIRRVPHRQAGHDRIEFAAGESASRWWMVALLFVASALRFSVNMALMFLCVRYVQGLAAAEHAEWTGEQIATASAPLVGNMNALLIVGMAFGGLLSGIVLPAGREKWPMVVLPILFSPAIFFLPRLGIGGAYILSVAAGFGFAAMVPVSIAVAQRLLPHRTSMASALMLGGAWALAFLGPQFAQWGIVELGLVQTYAFVAAALFVSGLVVIPLRSSLIQTAA